MTTTPNPLRDRLAPSLSPRRRWSRHSGTIGAVLVVAAVCSLVLQIATNRGDTASVAKQQKEIAQQAVELDRLVGRIDELQAEQAAGARRVVRKVCGALKRATSSLRVIIRRGDRNLASFYRDGSITRAQFERSRRASRDARRRLTDPKCAQLAGSIPVTLP